MPDRLTITRPDRPIDAVIELPRSKSVANRLLLLAALAGDMAVVKDPGDAEDTRLLRNLLRDRPRVLHCGMGGTVFRFLLAWAAVREGKEHIITGDARLLKRPHQPLVDALCLLGADIEAVDIGYRVRGKKLSGGTLVMDQPLSSQFISALLLVAPLMENGLFLRWTGTRVSEPYVLMTMLALEHFDVPPVLDGDGIRVRARSLRARERQVPPDWSSASFWFEMAALSGNAHILLRDLHRDHWQGDEAACELWKPWVRSEETPHGTLLISERGPGFGDGRQELSFNLRRNPDLFQPLVFTCAGLGQPARFTGLENLHLKETDRIAAVIDALTHMDIRPEVPENGFVLPFSDRLIFSSSDHAFNTFGDHRMAMSLAPLAWRSGSITLREPTVVAKSYPRFWEDLKRAGAVLRLPQNKEQGTAEV
jgi:3-phosphoshikimate 1-carboxyvinyltransferase